MTRFDRPDQDYYVMYSWLGTCIKRPSFLSKGTGLTASNSAAGGWLGMGGTGLRPVAAGVPPDAAPGTQRVHPLPTPYPRKILEKSEKVPWPILVGTDWLAASSNRKTAKTDFTDFTSFTAFLAALAVPSPGAGRPGLLFSSNPLISVNMR